MFSRAESSGMPCLGTPRPSSSVHLGHRRGLNNYQWYGPTRPGLTLSHTRHEAMAFENHVPQVYITLILIIVNCPSCFEPWQLPRKKYQASEAAPQLCKVVSQLSAKLSAALSCEG